MTDSLLYEYTATVVNIVDADTVDLLVDTGFRHTMRDRFRLLGIDAWETRGDERDLGRAAKQALIELISGREVIVRTHQDKRGKYGRWLADIYLVGTSDPAIFVAGRRCQHINKWLVDNGHAIWKDY